MGSLDLHNDPTIKSQHQTERWTFMCHPLRLQPILTLFGQDRQEISEQRCKKKEEGKDAL